MTTIATASNPRFRVSRVDIDREGPTYTIDTLRDIASLFPASELYFITGADALAGLMSWRDWGSMLDMAHFVGVTRPGYELTKDMLPGDAQDTIDLVDIPAMAISSTDCRARAQAGAPVWYLVPDGVVQYMAKNKLYQPDENRVLDLRQETGLVSVWTQPVLNMAFAAANQFSYSVQTGRSGVMNAINGYEAASGCRPQYILAGYSQGAMILAEHEKELAGRGQLAGVVYLGNALTAKDDPFTVGNTTGQGGILGWLPTNTVGSKGTDNRVNYCLPADGVCDLSLPTLEAASATGGDHGRYFLQGSQWDTQVADSIGAWIDQARYR